MRTYRNYSNRHKKTKHRRKPKKKLKIAGTISLPDWYTATLPKVSTITNFITKHASPKLINTFRNQLYPIWYNKIPYPERVDYVHGVNHPKYGQLLWKKHLAYMKQVLNINHMGKFYILKKGTILFHTASDILPFHKTDFMSTYPYPAYFFGLSSIIALWYAVEKYTELNHHQETSTFFKRKRSQCALEKPPYYLNIYRLEDDLIIKYIDDDIAINQEAFKYRACANRYPCLHPQYAYHSIEQLYTGRGPVELDFELTIPIAILRDGWTYSRGAKSNPFHEPIRYQLPPVIPLAVYEIDVQLLLQHAYENINHFNPLDAIDLNNPVWKK